MILDHHITLVYNAVIFIYRNILLPMSVVIYYNYQQAVVTGRDNCTDDSKETQYMNMKL